MEQITKLWVATHPDLNASQKHGFKCKMRPIRAFLRRWCKPLQLCSLILIAVIKAYRLLLSPLMVPCCRFYPSCSVYAMEALRQKGVMQGSWLMFKRIMKCHPWHVGGYDPVP